MKTIAYNDWLGRHLSNPECASRYLNAAQDDSPEMFLKALRKVASARPSSMSELANTVGVSRESLYRMTQKDGNPTFDNLTKILASMGLRMRVEPTNTR